MRYYDDLTCYRYYSVAQINRAVRIRRWRELGLPLDEIRTLLDQPDRQAEVLTRHEHRLRAEIEERQRSPLTVRTHLKEEPMKYRTEHLPARQTLSIRTRLQSPTTR